MNLFDNHSGLLPCITLHRPWADFVAIGIKKIETRTHKRFASLAGRRIGIHAAGHTWDSKAIDAARSYLSPELIKWAESLNGCDGKNSTILCTVLAAHHRVLFKDDSARALIDCENVTRYGLDLVSIAPSPIEGTVMGRQGIFYLPIPTGKP